MVVPNKTVIFVSERNNNDMKGFWNTIVEAYNANTGNKVGMIFVLIFTIVMIWFMIHDSNLSKKAKAEVEKFMTDNQKKISEIRIRIITCDSLKEWSNVKNWAIAAANNIRSNLIDIDYDYGRDYGNYLVKDITKMISRKEEELIRKTFKD